MAQAATCPKCACHLLLPADLPPGAQLACPECEEVFAPAAAKPIKLAQAVVTPAAPPADRQPEVRPTAKAPSDRAAAQTDTTPMPAPQPVERMPVAPQRPEQPTIAFTPPADKLGGVGFKAEGLKLDGLEELLSGKPEPAPIPKTEAKPATIGAETKQSPAEPASKPERSPGTLSDWLQRGGEANAPAVPPQPPAARQPGAGSAQPPKPQPKAVAANGSSAEREQPNRPPSSETVTASPYRTQPSVESLLSSFRPNQDDSTPRTPGGQADAMPAEQPASQAKAPPVAPLGVAAGPKQPAAPVAPTTAAPKPAPSKFEDLPVESLAAQAPKADPPGPASAPAAPRPAPASRAAPMPRPRVEPRGSESRPRRWRGAAVVAASGACGLAIGYLGLLWLAGPSSDVLGLSAVLPSGMLPASFAMAQPPTTQPPASQPPATLPPVEDAPLTPADDPAQQDRLVAPATYERPPEKPRARVTSLTDVGPQATGDGLGGDGAVRLIGAPTPYSVSELASVLQGADDARRTMSEKSLAATPEAARDLGSAYGKLCEVAQVLTFVDEAPADRELTALEAKELYLRLFTFAHARRDSCAMASRWLAWPERANGGVFFAGDLLSAERRGSVFEYRVKLTDQDYVAVLTDTPIDAKRFVKAIQIGVVGCVVEDPASRVEGYTGDAPRAVWACHTISLAKPRW